MPEADEAVNMSMEQPQKSSSRLKAIWDWAFILTFSSWTRFQTALALLVLILAGGAWHQYIGPVSYFFLLLIVLLLGALLIGVIPYSWRRQRAR
jgi:hypothetical protein